VEQFKEPENLAIRKLRETPQKKKKSGTASNEKKEMGLSHQK